MADSWLGITSTEYDSHCGDSWGYTAEEALDGSDYWEHDVDETHWLILDLSETYTIKKVSGRSFSNFDPTDVDVYVSDSKASWGTAVATNITTWQDTTTMQEVDTTDQDGRYIKIELIDTEFALDFLIWGYDPFGTWDIFDAYGDVAGGTEHTHSSSDTITISDSVSPVMTFKYSASDIITITDELAAAMTYAISLSDTMTISDAIEYVLRKPRKRKGRIYGYKPARTHRMGRIGM